VILSNLFRRKGRTIITIAGISVGVSIIIALGAVAQGLEAGFGSATQSSQADLILAQSGAVGMLLSSVDETIIQQLEQWPEVAKAEGVLYSYTQAGEAAFLYTFGHNPQGFSIDHFQIVEGQGLAEDRDVSGKPILLGRRAADMTDTQVGDAFRVTGGVFRVVGIYETGDAFEDGGAVLPLKEAQDLALQPHRVSVVYVKLDRAFPGGASAAADRLETRVARRFPDMTLFTTSEFVDQEQSIQIVEGLALAVAAVAVVIGAVVMANTLFMSVLERTREIGILRALGWSRWRVLAMILGEALILAFLGGLGGVVFGGGLVLLLSRSTSMLGAVGVQFSPSLFGRALAVVIALGLAGGGYPAWRASRLLPIEAMRNDADSSIDVPKFLPGGMVPRGLWRRRGRTGLTLLGVGVGIAAIVTLGAVTKGRMEAVNALWQSARTDLVAIEKDVADVGLSAIDQRVGSRIANRPDVEAAAGAIITFAATEKMPFLTLFGYHPREYAIHHFHIIDGRLLKGSHEAIVGRQAAEVMGVEVGETLRLLKSNFRVVGIYETGLAFEETGVVIGLREAQALSGRSRQVMWYGIKLEDPEKAETIRDELEAVFPDITFSLTAEFAENQTQFQQMEQGVGAISFLASLLGGLGMLNTMLMSVLERTREIGVLRALGWRQRSVLTLILQEAIVLGILGGICGVFLGLGLSWLLAQIPSIAGFGTGDPIFTPQLIVQAFVVALVTGVVGGLYPAWRATRMQPVEALRYE
jgi:ABC-type antimicrobial peptide transport system permease subunit